MVSGMNKTIGIFIPGRLNSERLPQKLLLPIGDTCLFDRACKKLNILPGFFNKYVLIRDYELIGIAKRYPNIHIIARSRESAAAEGPLSYIFRDMRIVDDTHLMFLNPCLVFLRCATIKNSIDQFLQSSADYATSVKPLRNWILNRDGKPINKIDYERLTTKEIEPVLQFAHCFHVFNKDSFFEDGYMLKDGFLPLPVPEDETIDVDTLEDFEFVKWKFERGER